MDNVIKKEKRIRKAVGAIVYLKNENYQFILIKKHKIMDTKSGIPQKIKGFWDFPKGGIKFDEDPDVAIKRELREELGTDKFIMEKFPFKLNFDFSEDIKKRIGFDSQETILYLARFTGDKKDLKIDREELEEYGIFSFKDALDKLEKIESKNVFKKVLSYLN